MRVVFQVQRHPSFGSLEERRRMDDSVDNERDWLIIEKRVKNSRSFVNVRVADSRRSYGASGALFDSDKRGTPANWHYRPFRLTAAANARTGGWQISLDCAFVPAPQGGISRMASNRIVKHHSGFQRG